MCDFAQKAFEESGFCCCLEHGIEVEVHL
jgi:hypothetical protein